MLFFILLRPPATKPKPVFHVVVDDEIKLFLGEGWAFNRERCISGVFIALVAKGKPGVRGRDISAIAN